MVALVVTLTVVVVLMGVLVAGLLRSHADILRALHELGAGVGDPAGADTGALHARPVPVRMGPTLPPERASGAHDVAGVTPTGDALALSVRSTGHATLLAFLSSGCTSCQQFWNALASDPPPGLPEGIRPAIVTKGPEFEIPAEVAARAPRQVPVVMSTEAWSDYEVPASPFFVLVDGATGRRVGEGVANHFGQVADLVRRALADGAGMQAGPSHAHLSGRHGDRFDGPAREADNDAALVRAGILPGDPSLYPRSLEDVFQGTGVGSGRPAPHASGS
ncbi:MAG TPA: hypothetical protein VMU14_12585 [Acidimicrobiales bacterium]|nr:hypothetical protein [Acidimicrobiales bacterium]